jgi:hypothetical protein
LRGRYHSSSGWCRYRGLKIHKEIPRYRLSVLQAEFSLTQIWDRRGPPFTHTPAFALLAFHITVPFSQKKDHFPVSRHRSSGGPILDNTYCAACEFGLAFRFAVISVYLLFNTVEVFF